LRTTSGRWADWPVYLISSYDTIVSQSSKG
jgi:hypothetical protein